MNIFDDKIRVEFNSYGGVVFHFDQFTISNTIGDKWVVTRRDNCTLQLDGSWRPISLGYGYGFESPVEAFWKTEESKTDEPAPMRFDGPNYFMGYHVSDIEDGRAPSQVLNAYDKEIKPINLWQQSTP